MARCLKAFLVVCIAVLASSAFAASDIAVIRNWDNGPVPPGGWVQYTRVNPGGTDSRRFRIENRGADVLRFGSLSGLVSGPCFVQVYDLVNPVPAGSSTYLNIDFTGCTAPGDYTATVTIPSNDPDTPSYRFTLGGSVSPPPSPDVAVYRPNGSLLSNGEAFAFATISSDAQDIRRFRIDNLGTLPLNISNAASLVSGPCFSQTETPAASLAPGASTYVSVRFHCGAPGSYAGALTIHSNDPDENPHTVPLSGTISGADIAVIRAWDDAPLNNGSLIGFGEVAMGTPVTRRFRIDNLGNATLNISSPGMIVSGQCFSQTENPATSVAPGTSTYFTVRFLCSLPGASAGAANIYSDDADEYPFHLDFNATAYSTATPDIEVTRNSDGVAVPSGGSFVFPTAGVNLADVRELRIRNTGDAVLNITNGAAIVSGACFSQLDAAPPTIAAGASATLRVRFQCGTPGTHSGSIAIHSNDPDEQPYTIALSGTLVRNNAVYVSQSIPAQMVAGQVYDVSVTMRNTGGIPWTAAGKYRLGIVPDAAASTFGISRVYLADAESIAPNATKTFTFQVRAPSATGTYSMQWRMLEELVEWFGDTAALTTVKVVRNDAVFVSQSIPTHMLAGQLYNVSVTMKNTGAPWTAAAKYRLGIVPDAATSTFGVGRVYLSDAEVVATNATKTFTFQVRAPSTPGTYSMQWRMVEELVEWFGQTSPAATVTVGTNDAAYVRQSVPAEMVAGRQYTLSVTMRNTGGLPWNEANNYRLGSQAAGDPWRNRIYIPSGVTVAPGAEHTFSWTVTAPSAPGTYNFQWRMVQEMVMWFGPVTPLVPVKVRVVAPPIVNAITPDTIRTGTVTSVTVTGQGLGASTVKFGRLDASTPSPLATLLSVSADGKQMTVRVDASNAAIKGFHPLVVTNADGNGAGEVRIVPAGPVVDVYTPSQASWGDLYFFTVSGVNLAGVQVVPGSSAIQFVGIEGDDGMLSGILEVDPGTGNLDTTIELRGAGGVASIPVKLRDRNAITQQTSLAGQSTAAGSEGVWVQDPVSLLPSTPSALNVDINCRWRKERTRARSGQSVQFRELGKRIDPHVLENFAKGETRRIQTLVTIYSFELTVSIEILCSLDDQGNQDFDVFFCITVDSYVETVGLGGQRIFAEACTGTSDRVAINGSGFWNFDYRWGNDGGSTTSPCVTAVDRSPNAFDGPRLTDVTMNNCCAEDLSIAIGYKLGEDPGGTNRQETIPAGKVTPSPASCPVNAITITTPPHNPTPPDLGNNFTFLAQREFADVETGETIVAEATVGGGGDPAQILWTITPSIGTLQKVTPSTKKGPKVSFIPDAPDHPQYSRGSGCSSPGNGSCDASDPLKYVIKAEYGAFVDENTLVQDQIDIIRQEYRNHGLGVPARSDFRKVTGTADFTAADINNTAYTIVPGDPGHLAQTVLDLYRRKIHDDIQWIPFGTTGVPPTEPVVGPGADIQVIGARLTTIPCYQGPVGCDDVRSGAYILAGPNGIVETRARNHATSLPLRINSGWRNPERNEAVNGVLNSNHQQGNAVDLDILSGAEGYTIPALFCVLQTAADDAGYNGFAENFSTQVTCSGGTTTHVHVQP